MNAKAAAAGTGRTATALVERREHLVGVVAAQREVKAIDAQIRRVTNWDRAAGGVLKRTEAGTVRRTEQIDALHARRAEALRRAGGDGTWELRRAELDKLNATWDETMAQAVAMDTAAVGADRENLARKVKVLATNREAMELKEAALVEVLGEQQDRAEMTAAARAELAREQATDRELGDYDPMADYDPHAGARAAVGPAVALDKDRGHRLAM